MKTSNYYCFLFILGLFQLSSAQDLVINEVCSDNDSILTDAEGAYHDWIEIYNNSDVAIDLSSYSLSDDRTVLAKWTFPALTLSPRDYQIVFATGTDANSSQLNANFKIKQSGESLFLSNTSGIIIDSIPATYIPSDYSLSRISDGNNLLTITDTPTPNASNQQSPIVYCSHTSGYYNDTINVELISSRSDKQIRYTTNGSRPNENSPIYTSEILFTKTLDRSPIFSFIPTTPLDVEKQFEVYKWKKPSSVDLSHVLRFALFDEKTRISSVETRFYFNHSSDQYTLPVVCIAADSMDLFDHELGIYIPGKRFEEQGFNWWPIGNYHNKGKDWERPIHMTLFDTDGNIGFETNAGIRMHGYGSVTFPQKSFKVYFRNEYGQNKIEYPIFSDTSSMYYKRLIFRNAGNDFDRSRFKDAMLQEILKPLNLELQDHQPSIVYINGEYWGIHNIRERYDQFYFESKFQVNRDSINVLSHCGAIEIGDNTDYMNLLDYVYSNDLSNHQHYNHVLNQIDIDNFIDFQIAEIFFANYDWPCNNYRIWKSTKPDSKWRFLIYDLDYSFSHDLLSTYNVNSLIHATTDSEDWPFCSCSNILFRKLLQNDDFQNLFLDRFALYLDTHLSSNRLTNMIHKYQSIYSKEIDTHIARWGYPKHRSAWEDEIEILLQFANERPCFMSEYIMSFFNLEKYDYECDNKSTTDDFLVLPNPNDGTFAIYNRNTNDMTDCDISLYSSNGLLLHTFYTEKIKSKGRFHIQTNNLNGGVYFLNIHTQNKTYNHKLVIF